MIVDLPCGGKVHTDNVPRSAAEFQCSKGCVHAASELGPGHRHFSRAEKAVGRYGPVLHKTGMVMLAVPALIYMFNDEAGFRTPGWFLLALFATGGAGFVLAVLGSTLSGLADGIRRAAGLARRKSAPRDPKKRKAGDAG